MKKIIILLILAALFIGGCETAGNPAASQVKETTTPTLWQ
jgi:PBP1b-binding outer membrane lipoprotein LpoB